MFCCGGDPGDARHRPRCPESSACINIHFTNLCSTVEAVRTARHQLQGCRCPKEPRPGPHRWLHLQLTRPVSYPPDRPQPIVHTTSAHTVAEVPVATYAVTPEASGVAATPEALLRHRHLLSGVLSMISRLGEEGERHKSVVGVKGYVPVEMVGLDLGPSRDPCEKQ